MKENDCIEYLAIWHFENVVIQAYAQPITQFRFAYIVISVR